MNIAYPNIPICGITDGDPEQTSVVQFWGFFSKDDLAENPDSLLMMDIDFGRRCSLRCPSCFRKSNPVDDYVHKDLTYLELIDVLQAGQTIGLREIKICGAGEPLENPLLLRLARDLTQRGMGLSVFTKAHVLGDDDHVARVFGESGFTDAAALCSEFFRLNISFLVSFQSADPAIQDRLVGGVPGYTERRNRGLELLARAGFNRTIPTRLALCANPIMQANLPELFDIYVYARERNILPVNAALMTSGKQIRGDFLRDHHVSEKEIETLFLQIYKYNLEQGIQTEDQLLREGISCMPGIHPCNQIAAGLYLTSNGNVLRCPGDFRQPLGNVRERSIVEIWKQQKDWPYKNHFNCHCPFKDGITLPRDVYSRVAARLFSTELVSAK